VLENNDGPLEPLTEFMTFVIGKARASSCYHTAIANTSLTIFIFQMQPSTEEKHTNTIDGTEVLPFDKLKVELFYPQKELKIRPTMT